MLPVKANILSKEIAFIILKSPSRYYYNGKFYKINNIYIILLLKNFIIHTA